MMLLEDSIGIAVTDVACDNVGWWIRREVACESEEAAHLGWGSEPSLRLADVSCKPSSIWV